MPIVNSDVCHVRLDSISNFEEICANLSRTARESGYDRPWTAYQVLHGPVGVIAFHTMHEDFKSLGAQANPDQLFRDVLGESEGRKALNAANSCMTEIESLVAVDRPEFSYTDDAIPQPAPMLRLTLVRATSGGQEALEELMRKVAEAIPKVDDPARFQAFQTLWGDGMQYAIATPLRELADLDAQAQVPELLNQAFGAAEGGLIFRSGREAIQALETNLSVYREDLSNPVQQD